MMNVSKFKVFITRPYNNIYCVITGSKSEQPFYICAEWHYIAEDKKEHFRFSNKDGEFKTIEQIWNIEVINNLKAAIYYKEIMPIAEKINDFTLREKIELQEIDRKDLISLSINNMEFFNFLKESSKNCQELKKFVDSVQKNIKD